MYVSTRFLEKLPRWRRSRARAVLERPRPSPSNRVNGWRERIISVLRYRCARCTGYRDRGTRSVAGGRSVRAGRRASERDGPSARAGPRSATAIGRDGTWWAAPGGREARATGSAYPLRQSRRGATRRSTTRCDLPERSLNGARVRILYAEYVLSVFNFFPRVFFVWFAVVFAFRPSLRPRVRSNRTDRVPIVEPFPCRAKTFWGISTVLPHNCFVYK